MLKCVPKIFQPKDEIVLRPQEVKDWPQTSLNVGQITAVSINSLGQPVIFHRAERVWDERSVINNSNIPLSQRFSDKFNNYV